MKKSLLIKLHVYSGLFTSFYLIAFGLSALILNHRMDVEKKDITTVWDSKVKVNTGLEDLKLAESTRNQLGLMGWMPPWQFKKENDQFHFQIIHPGRNYYLYLNLKNGDISVSEAPKGFIAVFHGLHFLNGKIPNAPLLIRSWAIYQWITLLVMFISLFLGIWLWVKYRYKTWEGIVFGSLFIGLMLLMLLL